MSTKVIVDANSQVKVIEETGDAIRVYTAADWKKERERRMRAAEIADRDGSAAKENQGREDLSEGEQDKDMDKAKLEAKKRNEKTQAEEEREAKSKKGRKSKDEE